MTGEQQIKMIEKRNKKTNYSDDTKDWEHTHNKTNKLNLEETQLAHHHWHEGSTDLEKKSEVKKTKFVDSKDHPLQNQHEIDQTKMKTMLTQRFLSREEPTGKIG